MQRQSMQRSQTGRTKSPDQSLSSQQRPKIFLMERSSSGSFFQVFIPFLTLVTSGLNPNITARFHNASIAGNPALSRILDGLNITIPVPSIKPHHKSKLHDSESSSPFLRSAIIHLLSRTAQFELFNPLSNSAITINSLEANATYQGEIVGTITEPTFNFEVLPGREGDTTTDKIPVEVGSVGYDAIRRALGGELVVDAVADVVATIGKWRGRIRYYGESVGAKVRL
jgi:hypothetical protein